MLDFCVFSSFENTFSMIGLDQNLLACTDTKHRTQHSKQSDSPSYHVGCRVEPEDNIQHAYNQGHLPSTQRNISEIHKKFHLLPGMLSGSSMILHPKFSQEHALSVIIIFPGLSF